MLLGMVIALVALGLTIIFGVMDIVNFAHGEFLMIGMYTGLLTAQVMGIDPLLTLPVAAIVGAVLGMLCYTGFVKFLLRGPVVAQLLGTFGLMLFLRNLALLVFGSEDRALHHGILVGKSFDVGVGIIIPATKLAAAILSVISFVGVWLLMNRTKVGKALTATALNGQGARYMGIPTERMNTLAWSVGGATVTVAGALIVNFWSVNPFRRYPLHHDRLCGGGAGRFWKCAGRFFCRIGCGTHYGNPRYVGLPRLLDGLRVDGPGAHDLFEVHVDLCRLLRNHGSAAPGALRVEAIRNAFDFSDSPSMDLIIAGLLAGLFLIFPRSPTLPLPCRP